MDLTVSPELLAAFWNALNEKPKFVNPYRADSSFDDILKKGWATLSDVMDILYLVDERVEKRDLSVESLCNLFDIPTETAFYRPSANSSGVVGDESLRCENVVNLMWMLERMGFNTDASYLVDKLEPRIRSRKTKLLTGSELAVFWFKKYRHKSDFVALGIKDWYRHSSSVKKLKTAQGYKIHAEIDEQGTVIYLKICSPKFRRKPDAVSTKCIDCGFQWLKGDPDSSASHRKEHKKRMHYLNPQPLADMLVHMNVDSEYELVTAGSPRWKHFEMYERALAFKREFQYDFVQWKSRDGDNDPDVNGYLFTKEGGEIIGACSFRKRKSEDGMIWVLDWVWVCPKERRMGHLATRWNKFITKYGKFGVEHPISDNMKKFLSVHSPEKI